MRPHICLAAGLLCGALLFPMGTIMADTYNGTETPGYAVTLSEGEIELRQYAPRLMAEVEVTGSRASAANDGFRILAGYIFGGNEGTAKIAMTTPVTETPVPVKIDMTTPVTETPTEGGWLVQFMMPAGWTPDSLPKASDPRIGFTTLPEERLAVLRFSGLAGTSALEARTRSLQDWIAAKGLKPLSGPRYFFYDPPWTLPWNRRNEVAFVVGLPPD